MIPARLAMRCPTTATVAILMLLSACTHQPESTTEKQPFQVKADRVDIQDGAATWSYLELHTAAVGDPLPPEPVPGRVSFDEARSVPIVAPLAGRVDSVAVRLGQQVQQGDKLVAVRSGDLVDLSHQIELLQARESARQKSLDRIRALVQMKAAPEKDLVEAEQALIQARLAREAAQIKLRSLEVSGEQEGLYWLTAPRDGVVVERGVLVGQEAGPERTEPLLVIADLDEVIVTADVSESDVSTLSIGQPAKVTATGGHGGEVDGTVEYIGQVVDPVRRMVNVRVRIRNDTNKVFFRPNAFTRVTFAPHGAPRVVAPAEAVVTDDDRSYVFVQVGEGGHSLQRREVDVGRHGGGQVEVLAGLAPGETYVTRGAILLLNSVDLES